jgi:hypothetical protein
LRILTQAKIKVNLKLYGVQQSRVNVVPRVVVSANSGEGGASGSNIMEGLLTLLLSDKLNLAVTGSAP